MNIFGYVLVILTVLITIGIGVKQPPMHSRLFVYDSQYTIVEDKKETPVEVTIVSKELPSMPQENKLTQTQRVIESEVQSPVVTTKVETVKNPVVTTQEKKNTTKTVSTPKTTVAKKVQPKVETKVQPKVETKVQPKTTTQTVTTPKTTTQTATVSQPVTKTQPVTQTVKPTPPPQPAVKVLTEQEELIAWNKWRSNLQNQLMRDSKLPILPYGTVFKISFNVDKSGKVSNIQTYSTNSKYTPYAIEYIAPVIRSYQGKAILEFPAGSKRTTTTFTGGWKISQSEKYSNPSDYNDIEKVVK